jgi:hypothetical protein
MMFSKTYGIGEIMGVRKIIVTILLGMVVCLLIGSEKREQGIIDYSIYYGNVDEQVVAHLAKLKTAIIEPRHFQQAQIAELKQAGTTIYGYLSFIEQNVNNPEFTLIKEDWFYKPDGEKIHHAEWDSWIMDLRNAGYRAFLMDQLRLEIQDKGLDGVLIDTVGDIDDFPWNDRDKAQMREAYTEILKQIKQENGKLKLIQNWGFQTAISHSKDYLDAVMWENFTWEQIWTDEWSKKQFEAIRSTDLELYVVSPRTDEWVSEAVKLNMHFFYNNNSTYNKLP